MVSYQNYLVTEVPIADAVNSLRLVSPEGQNGNGRASGGSRVRGLAVSVVP